MATDATGTPTSLGIPTFDVTIDAPSGNGNTAQMQAIDALLAARVVAPSGVAANEVPVWNGSAWVRSSATPIGSSSLVNAIGQPMALTGATAATRFVGGTASGAPTSGTFSKGDFVIDQSAAVWICTASGTPGTWAKPGASGGLTQLYDSGALGASQTTIDSGSGGFSTAFNHLRVLLKVRSDAVTDADQLWMQFNGDTGANYESGYVYGGSSTAVDKQGGLASAKPAITYIPGSSSAAHGFEILTMDIPWYAVTSDYRTYSLIGGAYPGSARTVANVGGGTWLNAANAINRIVVGPVTGPNLIAGSRLMIYGYN